MLAEKYKSAAAFSLVEIMLAITILAVAVLGTSGYRYYAALDSRDAEVRTEAARIALLLSENWKGIKGDQTYDPSTYYSSDLNITPVSTYIDPQHFSAFTPLGVYNVASTTNNLNYYVAMAYRDVDTGLRALNVVVEWDSRAQIVSGNGQMSGNSYSWSGGSGTNAFRMTTYVATD